MMLKTRQPSTKNHQEFIKFTSWKIFWIEWMFFVHENFSNMVWWGLHLVSARRGHVVPVCVVGDDVGMSSDRIIFRRKSVKPPTFNYAGISIMHALSICAPAVLRSDTPSIMQGPTPLHGKYKGIFRKATPLQLCTPSERAVWLVGRAFRGSVSVLFFVSSRCLFDGACETMRLEGSSHENDLGRIWTYDLVADDHTSCQ